MLQFTGVWYEAERYFQLSEVVSRCVMTNYTRGIDGKYRVSNQVTNRLWVYTFNSSVMNLFKEDAQITLMTNLIIIIPPVFSTGIKRILDGEIKPAASKAEEGKFHVKYTTIPLTPETRYSVLETDYNSYAVLWSCQGIGPIHAQNAWVMTRDRIPSGEVLQKVRLIKYVIDYKYALKLSMQILTIL